MAGKEQWAVEGYQFESEKDAKVAKADLAKIQKLEDKMDYRNPHVVFMVYKKAIDSDLFKSPVGYDYLRKLQKIVKESPLIKDEIPHIPISSLNGYTTPLPTTNSYKLTPVKKKEQKSNRVMWMVNMVLVVLVLVMFYITTTSSNPNIINYERSLQNRYATWEEELESREQALRIKEKELLLENEENR